MAEGTRARARRTSGSGHLSSCRWRRAHQPARRAALSIPANIAEGAGKSGNPEFRRFLHMALGSAAETDYHLLAARDLGLLEAATYDDLAARTIEVRRMLGGLIKRVTATLDSPVKGKETTH